MNLDRLRLLLPDSAKVYCRRGHLRRMQPTDPKVLLFLLLIQRTVDLS